MGHFCSTSCWRAPYPAAERVELPVRWFSCAGHSFRQRALIATIDTDSADQAFLGSCPPEVRKSHGVYFTPREVVGAQVRLVDDVLRRRLACDQGFGDERVLIVDPACGGGAYPLAILDMAGSRHPEVKQRLRLWESLPDAAALSRARGLPVFECDALHETPAFSEPVVVCIGNPPYRRRLKAGTLEGFTEGVDGVHLKNLYNDYVYFWHWALRTALEQRHGAAVVCLVTAASYVHGPAFGGMRRRLRQGFDDLWLIDLEGDNRAARASSNVFPIRTPVAIALGVRYAPTSSPKPAHVHYARIAGTAASKLSALEAVQSVADLEWDPARREWTSPLFAARGDAYFAWPALTALFPWQTSGAQFKRTWPVGLTPEVVRERWRRLLETHPSDRDEVFGATRDRDTRSEPPALLDDGRLPPLTDLSPDAPCPEPVRYAYRTFDRRWVVADSRLGDFLRPKLWRAHGPRQVYLTTMLTNVLGPGPAAVATACVPDLDQFRGSFGARGVLPLWRDAAATQPNVSTTWLRRLRQVYGREVTAPELLAYCYALLAGRGYTRRFENELRTPGPRVPLTLDASLFWRGVCLGTELIAVHTYRHLEQGGCRVVRPIGDEYPSWFAWENEHLKIGRGEIGPVAPAVWAYSVSGYPVLPSWLRRRIGPRGARGRSALDRVGPATWTAALTRELLDLVWLLERTLALEPDLEMLLQAVLSGGYFGRT